MINTDNSGLRYDDGKSPISLIPPEVILAYAEHMQIGAKKYKPRNWEAGMNWSRCYDSLMRHVLAWWAGEDHDPETGTHHMISALWNAGALYWYSIKNVGKDDRPKYTKPKTYNLTGYNPGPAKTCTDGLPVQVIGPISRESLSHWGIHNGN